MKRKIGFIVYIILFFSPLFMAFGGESVNPAQGESVEEISPNSAMGISEAVDLINQLEREIALTNKMIELREEGKAKLFKEASPSPDSSKESSFEIGVIYAEGEKNEELDMLPSQGEEGVIGRTENVEILPQEPAISAPPPEELGQPPISRVIEETTVKPKKKNISSKGGVDKYSEADLADKNYSIIMEKGQTAVISIPALTRFFATDTNVIEVSREGSEQVLIEGIGLGESFLHFWDKDGRKALRVKIRQQGADLSAQIKQRLIEAQRMESFKVRYSFDRYRLNSKSDNASRSYHYTDWVHRLGVTGETPWGMVDSKFQYEGKGYREDDFDSDLSAWNTSLRGPDLEMSAGDVGAYFSEITLPPTAYQGFRFKNPDMKNINFDTMWGVRGSRMWGKKVNDFRGRNYFYGGRFGVKPADFVNFNTTVMRSQGNDLDTSEVVAATGAGLNFFDGNVKLDGEYARGQRGDAFRIESDLKSDEYKFDFRGIYRGIDSDYQLVFDQDVPYRGENGYYLKFRYNPLKFLRYTGEYNKWRNKFLPNPEKPYRHNRDILSTFDIDLATSTRLSWSMWDMNRLGLSSPTISKGQSINFQHNFDFFKQHTSIFALYVPGTYKSPDTAAASYTERKLTIGTRMNVLKNLYWDISELWHYREMLETHDSGTSSSMSMGVSYSSQILTTPFYCSLAWRYKQDSNIMSAIQVLANEKYMEGEAELKYKPSSDMELYLRVNKKNIKPILDTSPTGKRDEMRIYGGGSYLLDTTLRFSNAGGVEGYVFKDLNNNGIKDAGEEGLSRIDLFAGKDKNTTTNEKGFYRFDKLKGEETSVLLDIKTLPEGYEPTLANPQTAKLEREKITEVNFGVLAKTEITGRVFNDLNMDGEMDGDDYGVADILVKLDDGSSNYTESSGYYGFDYVKPGERTISINPAAIKSNLLPLTYVKKAIKVEEGKAYKENFPLYALRTIIGTVFVDENGNGKFDADEEGVADIEIKIGDNFTVTDGMGRYFLKKLRSGSQKVEIVPESIPKEYEIDGEISRYTDLDSGGDIKEGIDFPLRRK